MKNPTKRPPASKRMALLLFTLSACSLMHGCGGGDAGDDQGIEAPPDKRVIVPDRGRNTTSAAVDTENGR